MNKILICILLQFVLFIPFYLIWRNDCKTIGKKSLGICVDSKEFGEYHPYNLEDKSKWELIEIIQKLSKQIM